MNRKEFLQSLAIVSLTGLKMKSKGMNEMNEQINDTEKMPVLFIGHGNPMNAIEQNEFSNQWREIGKSLSKTKAILCVSAHWETKGTYVTATNNPATIHDFGGFPQELFDVQYPAPGNPDLANEIKTIVTKTVIGLDEKRGLDHGCWSVLKCMFPYAGIPVIQLSLDYSQPAQSHYELGKELSSLRQKGVLIIGSGNMVHNLRLIDWNKMNVPGGFGFDWAKEANEKMKKLILTNDHKSLINYNMQGKSFNLSIPTPEHFLPLLYILALKGENEKVSIFNDKPIAGSLSMTSIKIDSLITD